MIKGLIFDLNGTLIDIYTSESDDQIYRITANFLDYYGIKIQPDSLREEYFSILRRQKKDSPEEFPEYDVLKLFQDISERYRSPKSAAPDPAMIATVFRAAGRYQLKLYDGVAETLSILKNDYSMAALSDGQAVWAIPEMISVNLNQFLDFAIISSVYKFRKPDPRLYTVALSKMNLLPEEVLFIGNDMYRDIFGAHNAGMKTVFFKSNQGEQGYCGANADYIIYHFSELLNAIDFLNRK